MSTRATFFVQECPTCGRRLRVCVEYLGKEIQCRHCRAIFVSSDQVDSSFAFGAGNSDFLQRVDRLLAGSDQQFTVVQPTMASTVVEKL